MSCSVLREAVRASIEAFRSAASPMLAGQEAMDDDDAECGGGGEEARTGKERRDRDTKLSWSSNPRLAGPRLRSS